MPHIIVEYSAGLLTKNFNAQALVDVLHETLAAEETVHMKEIKSRAIKYDDYRVGEGEKGDKEMIHITVKLLDKKERTGPFLKAVGEHLQKAAKDYAPQASVSAEIITLDSKTYCLSI